MTEVIDVNIDFVGAIELGGTMPQDERVAVQRGGAREHAFQDAEGIGELVHSLPDPQHTVDDLLHILERARSERVSSSSVAVGALLELLEESVQRELGRRRLTSRVQHARESREREPLRVRLIARIGEGAVSPSKLADELETAAPVISRELRKLKDDGLVEQHAVAGDGRLRVCALTPAGYRLLAEEYAFGERPEPKTPEIAPDVAHQLLAARLRVAISSRRRDGDLVVIAEDLERIRREADQWHCEQVGIQARAELAVTYGKLGRAAEIQGALTELGQIASGDKPGFTAGAAEPAIACRNYVIGRTPSSVGGSNLIERGLRLDHAESIFLELEPRDAGDWHQYHGLVLVAQANLLCERTEHGRALALSQVAAATCEARQDSWGLAKSLFITGTAMRLRGQFDDAVDPLDAARSIAENERYERLRADILFQLGDVHRCRKEHELAAEHLTDAHDLAEKLGLGVTRAYTESALGAVAFDRKEPSLREADTWLRAAQQSFIEANHPEGVALTSYRQVVLGRHMEAPEAATQKHLYHVLSLYGRLGSPAGIAAALTEWARLQRRFKRDVAGAVGQLAAWVTRPANRQLVQLDPWVPALIEAFADEVDAKPLADVAKDMVSEPAVVLERTSAREYEQLVDDPKVFLGRATREALVATPAAQVVEMAGEPRRDVDKLKRPPAARRLATA